MKILIATSDYPPALGGMAVYSESWARHLSDLGAEVTVLARKIGQRPEGKNPDPPAQYVEWKSGPLRDPIGAYGALASAIDRSAPDIVFAHTWIGWGPALARLKALRGTKFVLAAHGAEIVGPMKSSWYKFLMRQAFKSADAVFPVSGYTADHVAALGISRERIHVINNGVDGDRFFPGARNADFARRFNLENAKVVSTVGGLVDRKGHDIVIEALSMLKDRYPALKYVIAGGWALNSSREDFLRRLVAEKMLEDRVVFTGYLENALLPDVYRLCDVFVMPGREMKEKGWVEGFGISFLEAAACGIPIVATLSGGSGEAITDENAIVVPEENPSATADAIARILDDRALAERMSKAGVKWAESNSWRSKAIIGLEILHSVIRAS